MGQNSGTDAQTDARTTETQTPAAPGETAASGALAIGLDGERWLHVDAAAPGAEALLSAAVPEPQAVEAMLEQDTRPRRARFDDGDLVILRGVNLNVGAEPEDMIALRVWIGRGQIVTATLRPLRAIGDARERARAGRGAGSAAGLFVELLEDLTDRLKDRVRSSEDALEQIEDEVLEDIETPVTDRLKDLRRRTILLRRFAEPQLDAIEDLLRDPPAWCDEERRLTLREVANRTDRVLEALSATREHVAAVQDQVNAHNAERSRRAGHLLATVAAMFLPLNLFAALLGANVGGIPFAESPYGFWAVTGVALALLAAVWGLLRLFRGLR